MSNLTDIYVMPNASDTKGMFELFRYINNIQRVGQAEPIGLFFPVMLLVIFFISFISLLGFGYSRGTTSASKALTFSSFFVSILAMMLATMNLLAHRWMYLSIIATGLGAIWLILENAGTG